MKFNDKTEGLLNFFDYRKTRYIVLYYIMFILMILISLICLLPVIWVFLSGFKDTSEMYSIPPTLLPKNIDFSKVIQVWNMVNFQQYFYNTLIIILGCWIFDVLFNGLAGYTLSRIKPKGSAIIETLLFWTMMLPGISMVPLYMTFVDMPLVHLNLTGNFSPLWMMAGCNAFNIFLFRNFFNGIPIEYIEAAKVDGSSNIGIFIKIILPLAKPIVMVITIFSVTGSWSNFMWPYLLLGNTTKEPISILLYKIIKSGSSLQDNQRMLVTILSIIPPMIVYCLFSKNIMGGLDMSGIKG